MRRICAWCKTVIAAGRPGDPVSHGLCPTCLAEQLAEIAKLATPPPAGEPR